VFGCVTIIDDKEQATDPIFIVDIFFHAIKNNFSTFPFLSHQIAFLASFHRLPQSIQFGKIYFSSRVIFV